MNIWSDFKVITSFLPSQVNHKSSQSPLLKLLNTNINYLLITLWTGYVGEGEEEEDYFITFAWISVCDGDSEWNENGTQILFCPAL